MKKYHKIQTVFKRDPKTNFKTLLEGDFALPEFEYLMGNQWVFTEKVDGTNIRVMFNQERVKFGDPASVLFGGKTDNAQIPSTLTNRLNERFLTVEGRGKLKEVFEDAEQVCLYGEGFGPGIQSGGNYRKEGQDFVLFDVMVGDRWLKRGDVEDVAHKLDLEVVPAIRIGGLIEMVQLAKAGFKSHWGDFQAEGIVARPDVELVSRSGHRIITKIKNKDFRK